MNRIAGKLWFFCAICIAVASCGGDNSGDGGSSNQIVLVDPGSSRQISTFVGSTFLVEVSINNEPVQSFEIAPNQSTIAPEFFGVRLNESNSISVKWSEILNGNEVELSEQSQTFIAGSTNLIDSEHVTSPFDYDNDGQSNFFERSEGTCVWSANEICLEPGRADVPDNVVATEPPGMESESVTELPPLADFGNGDVVLDSRFAQTGTLVEPDFINDAVETFFDSDFSDPADFDWGTNGVIVGGMFFADQLLFDNEMMCVVAQPGDVVRQEVLAFVLNPSLQEPGRFAVQFDVRILERLAPVLLSVTTADGRSLVDHFVQGTREWQTYTIVFDTDQNAFIGPGFGSLRSFSETTYCLDNIKMLRL